jgi:DNA-binding NarL/FixJ family response regulator
LSIQGLSSRRRQILELVAAGLPEKQIADRLIRPSTVNQQMQHLHVHFGVHTRARLLAYLLMRAPRTRR